MIPPRTVLSAVDFSDTSRAALALAARLARQCGSALHVLHAEEPLLSAAAEHARIDLARETSEELERFIASAWPAAECAPRAHVATGGSVDVILDTATRQHADLVVVGSHGLSGAHKLVFGSTTEGLLRRADVPVLVTPAEWVAPNPGASDLSGLEHVIVGIDMSEASLAAARAGCQLATLLKTTLEVVHVVPDLPVLSRWRTHAEAAVRERVAQAREELAPLITKLHCPVPVDVRVESGDVPTRLADAAGPAGRRAILVLGKKAPRSAGAAPGSTAYRVLSLSSVPVLMYVEP